MEVQEVAKSQIQAVIDVLLYAAGDKNQTVCDSVNTALRKIAKKHPNDVLRVCCEFFKLNNNKLCNENVSDVLKSMEHICQEYIVEIDGDTIITLIDFSMDIMTRSLVYEPILQSPASSILVALGGKHSIQVIEALLNKLEVGVIPHYTIPFTLGSLATSCAFGIVPYLKDILDILIPLMGNIKIDQHKFAFSFALGRFSDALIEYVTNSSQAPDPTITSSMFHKEMGIAYDILIGNWLYTKDPRVLESVLLAISSIFSILSVEKVSQQTQRIISTLLNLYRKQKEPLPITQCLGSAIQVSALSNGTLLEPLLTQMFNTLFELVCAFPDYAQPELVRNHNEVLRCYEKLVMYFTDNCLDHLITQLKHHHDKERIRALLILTHLANSSNTTVQSRLNVFLQILSELLNEQNIKVKKAVLKTVVAFANKDFLPKGGEQKYLEFIVKLCGIQTNSNNKIIEFEQQELSDLQTTADNTLYMLSTSVVSLEGVLSNLLLNCFLLQAYNDSCNTILRCLTYLAAHKQFLNSCEPAFVRCLALLAQPTQAFRGTYILNFLKNIKLSNSEKYQSVWDTKIGQLVKYVEQNYDQYENKEWEDLVVEFLMVIIDAAGDVKLNETLALEAKNQLPLYNSKSFEKRLLLKCLSLITCYVRNEILVVDILNTIIEIGKCNGGHELSLCAEAIGLCSRSHLKIILSKFKTIRKEVLAKKPSKYLNFNFMNNQKNEIEIEKMRLLILMSYAEICKEAPGEQLLQTIQHEILDFAISELNNSKDFNIRQSCVKTIGAVADALHPNRNSLHIQLQDREVILNLISSQMQLHNGPDYIELYPTVLPVITSLVRLPPALESEQRKNLLRHCFNSVFNAAAIYCKINAENNLNTYYGDLKLSPFVYSSFSKLNFVVQELLSQSLAPSTLDEIVSLLEPWLSRKKAEQRLPALETLRDALQTYLDHVKFCYEGPTAFTQSGFLLARVVPRCTDSNRNMRKVGVEALRLVLCITARYEGHARDHDKVIGQALESIQEQIESDNPKLLFQLTTDLAHVIINHLPQIQLPHFVNYLMEALLDVEASSSNGSSVVLNTVFKHKGGELLQYVAEMLNKLLSTLNQIQCSRTRSATLRAVLSLAIHHPKIVINNILTQPLPYEQNIIDCWSIFSTDINLVHDILEQFKKVFKNCVFYEETQSLDNLRIVTLQPLQVICAMSEIFKSDYIKEECNQQFSEIFSYLFITLASYINTAAPASLKNSNKKEKYSFIPNRDAYKLNPTNTCVETFKLFLICGGLNRIAEPLVTANHIENLEQFLQVTPALTQTICENASHTLAWIVTCLAPYTKSEIDVHRIAVTAFLAAAIRYRPSNQNVLTENILEMLLGTQTDSCCMVRQIGLQGLGYSIEYLSWDMVSRHCDSILNAFMQGLDYNNISVEHGVALEAMLSFSKLLKTAAEQDLNSCQVTAAMRIKPLFEQENSNLREAAFRLLGDLATSINNDQRPDAFKEQVCGCLITLLLHLCDDNKLVVKACKYSLRKVTPLLNSNEVNKMVQNHLLEEGNLHYADFITDLIKAMSRELLELFPLFIMTCVSYFKSPWIEVRGYAALITGLLYSHLNSESKTEVCFDTVCHRLLQLLKDDNPQVRTRAVQATANLFIT